MTIHARTGWGIFIALVGFVTVMLETGLSIYFHRTVIASVIFIGTSVTFVGGYLIYPKLTDALATSFRTNAIPFIEAIRNGRRSTDPVIIPAPSVEQKDEDKGLG